MSTHPLLLVLLSSLLSTARGWANGYDTSICTNLTPPDGSAQTSQSPFSITLAVIQYNQGGEVRGMFYYEFFFYLSSCHLRNF